MAGFDVVRGFSVLSMVLFHLCYDLRFIYHQDIAWFKPPLQDIWRASISWTFLFVAGCMCSLTQSALRRAGRYLAFAAAVFVATTLAAVDVPISFGIIYCMGASTLLEHALSQTGLVVRGYGTACALSALFLVLRGVPHGSVGIGPLVTSVPHALYQTPYLSFLGFPGPHFASGDYYPPLPFSLMYLAGAATGRTWHERGYPRALTRLTCPPLECLGRHALPIYVLHQPVLLLLLELLLGR